MNARLSCLKVLNRVLDRGGYSSQSLDAELSVLEKDGTADRRDIAFITRNTLGVIQNLYLLDFYIDSFTVKPEKLDKIVRNILRLGVYQIVFSDSVPARAAVNESVELCKASKVLSASSLVNAVLRKISDAYNANALPEPSGLSVKYSHPEWFVQRMISLHGGIFAESFLKADNEIAEISYHEGFSGEKYVQDMAAYRAVEMAKPLPGESVLDCCAAPGGKSFTAACLMNNKGKIVSCDIHEKKLKLVREGALRLGISIIETVQADASKEKPEFIDSFDLVIADVPCSGFGVIRKKPEIRYKSEYEIAGLPEIQEKIINNVSKYVKAGGRLLYSTCTVFPEENEDIVNDFLLKHTDFSLVEMKAFYPNTDGTDGFFAAVMKKK